MEHSHDLTGMLDLMIRPAFTVCNGIIQYCNQPARQCMICPGAEIDTLLETGRQEYAALNAGSLCLRLKIDDHRFDATVTRMSGFDVFILDREDSLPQLQAMALAARELRIPLANMMLAADRLLPADGSADQNQKLLEQSMYHMFRLIDNMSDAARYTEETLPRQQLRNIPAIIGDIFEKAVPLAAQAGVTVRFANCPQSVVALTDEEKLERAVYNILSNAIKFSGKGGIVDASLSLHGDKLYLTVCDNGSGIADDILGNVFSRHLRQPGLEESRQGIGLGMLIIRSAASAHGGTVLIEKGSKNGTKLTMTLAVRKKLEGNLASTKIPVDYTGGFDRSLIELADILPR